MELPAAKLAPNKIMQSVSPRKATPSGASWRVTATSLVLALAGQAVTQAQTSAVRADEFLNSLGVNTHIRTGQDSQSQVIAAVNYLGVRNLREGASASTLIAIHNATGAKFVMPGWFPDITAFRAYAAQVHAAGALLAVEGPNEPNNWPVTYNGQTSSGTNYLPIAQYQRDLYSAVHADPNLAGIPVFHTTDAAGAQPNNCGLQFRQIPSGAGTLMPDGTTYADYLNCHNYVCKGASIVDNNCWNAFDPLQNGPYNGLYPNYGNTWNKHYVGHSDAERQSLPRVCTENGWFTQGSGAITEAQQARLFLNLYLAAFKRGWSHTFMYMMHDDPVEGYWGFYRTDWSPKPSAVFLHNMTTILADSDATFIPGSVAYAIPGQPSTVHDLLLQKGDGTFELVVWNERASGSNTVTVNLGATYNSVKVYDPTTGTAPIQTLGQASSVTLTLSDHPNIIEMAGAVGTEMIVDNGDPSGVTLTGAWTASTFTPGYHGANYLHDGNTGKGTKSVRFTPNLPAAGSYEVFARWTSNPGRANNVPIDIVSAGGTTTVTVNQQTNGGQWNSLGIFSFAAGSAGSVLVRTNGTNGYVIADAVKFAVSGGGGGGSLPSPWASQDIGAVGLGGAAAYASGTFTLSGAGLDTDNTSVDSFRYVYQPASGDCSITARVASQQNNPSAAKYGVMIRQSLTEGSANAFMMMYPAGLKFKYRTTTGGTPVTVDSGSGSTPYWLRVTRAGNTFTAYKSTDGINWTTVGSVTISMGTDVYIGLLECSTNPSQLGTVTFDNVTATP